MKQETVVKILKRYVKGLSVMEQESISQGNTIDAEHYMVDRKAFEQAIKFVERSNTKS